MYLFTFWQRNEKIETDPLSGLYSKYNYMLTKTKQKWI